MRQRLPAIGVWFLTLVLVLDKQFGDYWSFQAQLYLVLYPALRHGVGMPGQ